MPQIYQWNKQLTSPPVFVHHLNADRSWANREGEKFAHLPNFTAIEPSKQTSAKRKKQKVGQRRPQLEQFSRRSSKILFSLVFDLQIDQRQSDDKRSDLGQLRIEVIVEKISS